MATCDFLGIFSVFLCDSLQYFYMIILYAEILANSKVNEASVQTCRMFDEKSQVCLGEV